MPEPPVEWDSEFDLIPEEAPVKFNSGEHADIPSECKIPTGSGDERVSGKYDGFRVHTYEYDKKKVPTGTEVSYLDADKKRIGLTFSKVLALAGDFFCNKPPEYCISRGQGFTEQKKRFEGAIKDMVEDPNGIAPAMQKYLSDEITGIEAALADVPKPGDEAYEHWQKAKEKDPHDPETKGPQNIVQNYVKETGGVATFRQTLGYVGSIYSTILIYNMDHFGQDAWTVYRAGHALALKYAKEGKGKIEELKKAYLYDAFALHYLTDQFASGHVRVPRPEFNFPGAAMTVLQIASFLSEKVAPSEALEISAGAWDRMTNYMHDGDGSIGLRVTNRRGESWITYGDKQYFAEPNRINRLKSIECAQSSIEEVFDTWRKEEYPKYARDSNGNLEKEGDTNKYAALQIAPIPMTSFIEDNHDATGNASSFWIVERNINKPDVRQNKRFGGPVDTSIQDQKIADEFKKATENLDKNKLKPASKPTGQASTPAASSGTYVPDYSIDSGSSGIALKKEFTENGYYFARRTDPELCSLNLFQWGNPGYSNNSYLASWDASAISKSQFRKHDFTPADVRAVEIYSGGFIQPQEYCKKDGTVNYAVNVWGPVEVPIRFLTEQDIKDKKGRTWTDEDLQKGARQFTFTLRGRRSILNGKPETASATKNYRWLSWAELGNSGKTSLLKFTHSYNSSVEAQRNAIVVEAWSMSDPFPKTPNQFSKYESLKTAPEGLVFGGPSDKDQSQNAFDKTVLVSGLPEKYYENYAHMTRFFVFPFSQGSGPSNPDIVTISWKGDDMTKAQSIVSVVSTGPALTSPTLKRITSEPQNVDGKADVLSGFLKPFKDVNNKPMILHARATEQGAKSGMTILTQVYYQEGENGKVTSKKPDNFEMKMTTTPSKGDNYQILVGDTRYSGNPEMVVMAGEFPNYYLRAWEMKDFKWEETTPIWDEKTPITHIGQAPEWETQSKKTEWKNNWCEHRLCALVPNEISMNELTTTNGLNVLLVSRYSDPGLGILSTTSQINFRTYIKGGSPPPELPKPGVPTKQPTSEQPVTATPSPAIQTPPNQTQGPRWQWIIVSWSDNATSIVPSWVFIPRRKSGDNPLSPIKPPTVTDQSPLGTFGDNNNLNNFAKTPPPGADTWPCDMAIVTGQSMKPGSLVSAPQATPMVRGDENLPSTQNYGRFEASPTDLSSMIPCLVKKSRDGGWGGFSPTNPDAGMMTARRSINGEEHYFEVRFGADWRKSVLTSYVYDVTTKKPTAVMWLDWQKRIRIINPEELLKNEVKDVTVPPPPSNGTTQSSQPTQSQASGSGTVSTVPRTVTPSSRGKAGWSGYVDCLVDDALSLNMHYKDMGWRLAKLGSIVGGKEEYGVMNVFSFHGMLGVRVWAPAEPGRYNQWISRGCTPYLGQTSLGTGWDSSGHWNDNASQLSWGMCEDFPDMNIWHGEISKSVIPPWTIVEGTGWATPYTQAKKPYARGYESKKPEWPHQEKMKAPA